MGCALQVAMADAPHEGVRTRLDDLAETIGWLAAELEREPADKLLAALEWRLDYKSYLRLSSGFIETGEAKAANVTAAIAYARGKGVLSAFLAHIDELARTIRDGSAPERARDAVELTTIFRAKGREWPIVIVPGCNQGLLPFGAEERREEERRLFYVALTRTRELLHLHALSRAPLSQFLEEAEYQATLEAVAALRAALETEPTVLRPEQVRVLAIQPQRLHLERYFARWWAADAGVQARLAARMRAFFHAVEQQQMEAVLGIDPAAAGVWQAIAPEAELADEGAERIVGALRADHARA